MFGTKCRRGEFSTLQIFLDPLSNNLSVKGQLFGHNFVSNPPPPGWGTDVVGHRRVIHNKKKGSKSHENPFSLPVKGEEMKVEL